MNIPHQCHASLVFAVAMTFYSKGCMIISRYSFYKIISWSIIRVIVVTERGSYHMGHTSKTSILFKIFIQDYKQKSSGHLFSVYPHRDLRVCLCNFSASVDTRWSWPLPPWLTFQIFTKVIAFGLNGISHFEF